MNSMGIINTVPIKTTKTFKTIMTTVRNKTVTTENKIDDKKDIYNIKNSRIWTLMIIFQVKINVYKYNPEIGSRYQHFHQKIDLS